MAKSDMLDLSMEFIGYDSEELERDVIHDSHRLAVYLDALNYDVSATQALLTMANTSPLITVLRHLRRKGRGF